MPEVAESTLMRMDSATSPKGMRRMTAWLEMSHFRIKEDSDPVLVEQILLNCRYLLVHLTKTGARVCV